MALISLGDMAQTFMLRRLTTAMKQDARVAAQELTTGRTADIGKRLGGEIGHYTGLESALSRLQGYTFATDKASMVANTMQTVFGTIDNLTEDLASSLLNATTMENTRTLDALIHDVTQRLDAVLSALNTKLGDSTIFAGIESDGPAVAKSDVILSALAVEIAGAGAVTADEIETVVTAWFASPTGFGTVGYLGGAASTPFAISADDRADFSITAADPALRDTIKSLSLVALMDRGTVAPDRETSVELVRRSGNALLQNHSDRALLGGRLGLVQGRIDHAQTRNQAEETALKLARSELIAVDPYEAATRMEAAQNQLETLYSVTARLSRMSLVDFLR